MKYLPILIALWSHHLWAEQRQIELRDGSVITGEILVFDKGIYTVKSTTLGTLQLKDSDIQTIRSNPAASPNFELNNLQILQDPEMMNLISSLSMAPQFQAILQDPEVINAVTSGNFNGLLANFSKLLEHPREIAKKIQAPK